MTDAAAVGPHETVQPTPRAARIAFLVLCAIGACLAADLIRLHVKVHTDPDYHSYCAISERVDCETVAESPHSVFAGVPTAVWGLFGYLLLGGLSVWGLRARLPCPTWPFGALFWLSAGCTLTSLWLFGVSLLVIRSTCIVCAGTYVVNLALVLLAAWELARRGSSPLRGLRDEMAAVRRHPVAVGAVLLAFAAVILAVEWAVPPYWRPAHTKAADALPTGRTADGHWWIGAVSPTLEVVEFSDYQCPFCARGHAAIRHLLEQHPDRLRVVHRHFPLDSACNPLLAKPLHPRACRYAALAECAGAQGRFWEASDLLYARGRREAVIMPEELARGVGIDAAALRACLDGPSAPSAIAADVRGGIELQVRGTPTFFVDGRSYPGSVPEEVIRSALAPAPAPVPAPEPP